MRNWNWIAIVCVTVSAISSAIAMYQQGRTSGYLQASRECRAEQEETKRLIGETVRELSP